MQRRSEHTLAGSQPPRVRTDPAATGAVVRGWGLEGPQTLDHIPAPPEERAAQPGRLPLRPLVTQPSFPRGLPAATMRASRGHLYPAAEWPSQGHSSYSPGCCSFRRPRPPRVSVALRAVPQTRLRGAGGRCPGTREGCSPLPAVSILLCAPGHCSRLARAHTAAEGGQPASPTRKFGG